MLMSGTDYVNTLNLSAGHRNVYVAVHVPKRSSKHKHRSRKKHSRNGHHHSDRSNTAREIGDHHDDVQSNQGNEQGSHGNIQPVRDNEAPLPGTPEESGGITFLPPHSSLRSTMSDVPTSSRTNSLSGRPRYNKSHSLGTVRGECVTCTCTCTCIYKCTCKIVSMNISVQFPYKPRVRLDFA